MSDLIKWVEEIKRGPGRSGWIRVYKEAFHLAISDPDRFYSAIAIYGDSIMLDAIITCAPKKFSQDPLGYLIAVAHSRAQEELDRIANNTLYDLRLGRDREATRLANEETARKIEKAKELSREG